jgi:hypothetical protein
MLQDPEALASWARGRALDAAGRAMRPGDAPLPVHVIEAVMIEAMAVAADVLSCATRRET